MEGITLEPIEGIFSKGLIDYIGSHRFSPAFSPYLRNVRIKNECLTVRPWFYEVFQSSDTGKVQGMASVNWTLYAVYSQDLYSIDLDAETDTKVSTSTLTSDSKVDTIVFWQYLIILTGDSLPKVRDAVGSTWTSLTTSNIESWANPRFGTEFLYFTVLAWWGTKKNRLYFSRGITQANPEYCYDWAGTGSEILYMKGDIQALAATLDRLFVFTDKTVEYFDTSTIQDVSGLSVSYTKPLSKYNVPVWPDAVVVAQDRILFFTKDFNVKELLRGDWISDIEIGNLSDRKNQSIREFMKELDDDQSECFGLYNQEEELVMRHLRKAGDIHNNITLIYDLVNDTFLVDDSKYFRCLTYHNNKIYAGSDLNSFIYREWDAYDDDGFAIDRERKTIEMNLGNPNMIKYFREIGLSGEHNSLSNVKIEVFVDGEIEAWPFTISWEDIVSGGIATYAIGDRDIAGDSELVDPKPFEEMIPAWELRWKWVKIQIRLYWSSFWAKTVIDTLSIWAKLVGKLKKDKKLSAW